MKQKPLLYSFAIGCCLMPAALGQNNTSWVSSTGSDVNSCTESAPCATFKGALTNTNSGGEIDVVDSADYGSVTIYKPVTIDGSGKATISSFSVESGVPISIAASNVTVRNLTLVGNSSNNAIVVTSGANITVSRVQMSGFSQGVQISGNAQVNILDCTILQGQTGINAQGTVVIRNSTIDGSAGMGVSTASGTTMLDGAQVINCGTGIFATSGATVLLRNSSIMGNTTGLASSGGASIVSFVTNAIYNNTTNGAPTSSVFQK